MAAPRARELSSKVLAPVFPAEDISKGCRVRHSEAPPVKSQMKVPGASELSPCQGSSGYQGTHLESSATGVSHAALLYYTLVQDGALPGGYLHSFESLSRVARYSAERTSQKKALLTNADAAVFLHDLQKKAQEVAKLQKSAEDQFLIAAAIKPRRFHARFQKGQFEGTSARQDAEEAERRRWLRTLSDLLKGTPTPMGTLLLEKATNENLLGGGRRASTLRSRVRSVRKFLSWLAITHECVYPTELTQLTDFLQVRLSEPCNRGALKGTHHALIFLEEMAGVTAVQRFTSTQLYNVVCRELLSSALPGRPSKQAPRVLTTILAALEELVHDENFPSHFRAFSWWLLVQNWATLRFSDPPRNQA